MGDQFVGTGKRLELQRRMAALGIDAGRLVERFITGSGKGGQKLNKTSSCVFLSDPSSGIEVKCQRTRSRELNRFLAARELCERLEARRRGIESARERERERIRRQKRRRSRRQRERMLADKRHHAAIKNLRQSPAVEA